MDHTIYDVKMYMEGDNLFVKYKHPEAKCEGVSSTHTGDISAFLFDYLEQNERVPPKIAKEIFRKLNDNWMANSYRIMKGTQLTFNESAVPEEARKMRALLTAMSGVEYRPDGNYPPSTPPPVPAHLKNGNGRKAVNGDGLEKKL